jgi:hypothetical protein
MLPLTTGQETQSHEPMEWNHEWKGHVLVLGKRSRNVKTLTPFLVFTTVKPWNSSLMRWCMCGIGSL